MHSSLTLAHNHAQAGFAYLTQTREERFFVNIRKRLDHAVAIDTERCGVCCVVLCVFSEVVPIMCEPKAACYCTSTVLRVLLGGYFN